MTTAIAVFTANDCSLHLQKPNEVEKFEVSGFSSPPNLLPIPRSPWYDHYKARGAWAIPGWDYTL